jgi:hypothetical protein
MKRILLYVLFAFSFMLNGFAQCTSTDVVISQYIEGGSNNKCIEFYNGTGSDINLASPVQYSIREYFNGSDINTYTTINLTGTIPAGGVYVLCHASSALNYGSNSPNQTSSSNFFNGDDAIALVKGTTLIDIFGQIGNDPGSQWGTGNCSTADNTLIRDGISSTGTCPVDIDGANAFDPAAWAGSSGNCLAIDATTDLFLPTPPPCAITDILAPKIGYPCSGNNSISFDLISANTSTQFTLSVLPSVAGVDGTYNYADLPLTLSDFDPNTDYTYTITDATNPSCTFSETISYSNIPFATRFTPVPSTTARANDPFDVTICVVDNIQDPYQCFSGTLSLTEISGVIPQPIINPSTPQTATNGCYTFTVTPDINAEGTQIRLRALAASGTYNGQSAVLTVNIGPPLPIELKYFNTKKMKNGISIQWATVSEENNALFLIEKSVNNSGFKHFKSINSSGNSNTEQAYTIFDNEKQFGNICYKLYQQDIDGKTTLQGTSCIKLLENISFQITQNPTYNNTELSIFSDSENEAEINIFNANASKIYHTKVNLSADENIIQIPSNNWTSGMYFIQILSGENILSQKLIKQ